MMWIRRTLKIALPLVSIAVLTSTVIADQPTAKLGSPLPGLTADQLTHFQAGLTEFQSVEGPDDGLGPVFNEASCATCHVTTNKNNVAIGGTTGRLETRFGTIANGVFDAMAYAGGSLLQDHAIGAVNVNGPYTFVPEQVPGTATIVAKRRTTPLFGLGLVDAVPDQTFQTLAQLEKSLMPSIAGTVAMVPDISSGTNKVGKFGWKGQNPTLFQFSGDAYLNEMGVTSPQFPNENCPQGDCSSMTHNPVPSLNDDGTDVQKFTDFMAMLAPPPRGPITTSVQHGEILFHAIGCAQCHRPTLITGANPVPALNQVVFHPYSDFLLHDMGSLGDGIVQGPAGATMMRTAPLWGLRFEKLLLHDGRASNPRDAILAHDGQAKPSRTLFNSLSFGQKSDLIAFLNSL
jgi:CxxC motif-containing protein (DUF1111 family)